MLECLLFSRSHRSDQALLYLGVTLSQACCWSGFGATRAQLASPALLVAARRRGGASGPRQPPRSGGTDMRIFIAGLIGGIVLFVWGAVAHMVLPDRRNGHEKATQPGRGDRRVAGVGATRATGVYMIPGMDPDEWRDEARR